jgi:2-oxoglutarate ferredoxin oxidoreductase subunit beta
MHVTHGRALAFANGVKMADPELNVFVFMGDGDAVSIGGNHFIHTCRRNINITAIIINNNTYGMTGGQYSPMTPTGMKATTTTYGSIDRNFDIADLARAAGATFVGRAGTYQMNLLKNLIAEGADHNGFAVIEAVSQCPVNFGRRNKMADPVNMITWQKENTVPVGRAAKMTPEELDEKIVTGKLYKTDASEYTEEYKKLIDRAMREK